MVLDKRTDTRLVAIAPLLKVCGHPLRLKILSAIERGTEPCVSELWACLNLPQPVVSQHLAVLKRRGIVSSRVVGNRRVYVIREPYIRRLIQELVADKDSAAVGGGAGDPATHRGAGSRTR